MINLAKKIMAGTLTAMLLVSNYSFNMSASSVEPVSDTYTVLEDESLDEPEEDTKDETKEEPAATSAKETPAKTPKAASDDTADDPDKSSADKAQADPAKSSDDETPADSGTPANDGEQNGEGTPSADETPAEPAAPSTGGTENPPASETPVEPGQPGEPENPSTGETPSEPYKAPEGATLSYRTRARNKKKWEKKYKSQSNIAGSINKKKTLEAIQMKLKSSTSGKLQYRVHMYKRGWSGYKTNGKTAGRKGAKLNQIQIRLTGQLAEKYDVYYRVHVRMTDGWTNWAKNGESAGAAHYARFIEAIQVVLTEKDAGMPGDVLNIKSEREEALINANDIKQAMTEKAQSMTSKTKWLILCDTKNYFAAVFKGSQGNWKMVRFIYVAVGKPSTPTKKGTFYVRKKKKKFFATNVRCKYCTSFKGSYYFHSWPYYWNGKKVYSPVLGKQVSHGCVRMATDDAKYIYKKVPLKSKVVVY